MKRVAIVGAGISGLSTARLLDASGKAECVVFEALSGPGGLVRCERVDGSLYHVCGGHVFNTKYPEVWKFFSEIFSLDEEFLKTDRNSTVFFPEGEIVDYPVENHVYMMDDSVLQSFISDLLSMQPDKNQDVDNFQDFLRQRFGETLYEKYFRPYNEKVWKRDLSSVPITWLEGKLPMPSREEMIFNNIRRVEEKSFVHSTFWYEKVNGSQYLADKMAKGLDIRYNSVVESIYRTADGWIVEGEKFDMVVFCGNILALPGMLKQIDSSDSDWISRLQYHGTTSVFCEIDGNPYSWIYLADAALRAHRIICTGNFSPSNNAPGKMTGTVEFTDEISREEILEELGKMPLSPRYIAHTYNPCTYPIQDQTTRNRIDNLKQRLAEDNFYLTGRFADWEYYNMDVAMKAAMTTVAKISEHL